jgi:hypothetical protein
MRLQIPVYALSLSLRGGGEAEVAVLVFLPAPQPENVLLHSDGLTPILVDFGSMAPAEIRVSNRWGPQALGGGCGTD